MNPAAVSRTSADGVTAVQPVTDVAEADQSLSNACSDARTVVETARHLAGSAALPVITESSNESSP